MKKSVKAAIDKIIELRSDFSDADIFEAVKNLANSDYSPLLESEKQGTFKIRGSHKKPKNPRKEPELSKIVADLKELEPDKFELLSRFDRAFRQGEVLKTLEQIRITGASIDKSFNPGKSRKGAVSKFMKLLASLPTKEARIQIDRILQNERNSYDSEVAYSRLAAFIIGKNQ